MDYLRGRWNEAITRYEHQARTAFVPEYRDQGGLQDPLATVRSLRGLDTAVRRAKGREAKAAGLLRMGDYYSNRRYLLLYSGPLWRGQRDLGVAFSWNAKVATPPDDQALRRHYDEHECFAQALVCYRRILREFPNSQAAPPAAYRAAVALERLSNMAAYWRWREDRDDRQGEAVRLMAVAAGATDPKLAAKARKYGKVFADDRRETRKAFANESAPPRRWEPYDGA